MNRSWLVRRRWILLLATACLALGACPGAEDRPLSRGEIFEERKKIPTLYLTDDGREIIAPGTEFGAIVDPQTKKLAWAAMVCENPACPGPKKGDRPYLFTWPNPVLFVAEDGTVASGQPITPEQLAEFEKFKTVKCPACAAANTPNPNSAGARRFVLPEAEKRLQELEAALQLTLEREAQRKQQAGEK